MVQDVRQINRGMVLAELLRTRPTTRRDIAVSSGISPTTVTRTVDELIAEGIVREGGEVVSAARGRRPVLIDFVAEGGYVAGVDLGASTVRVAVADLVGAVQRTGEYRTPSGCSADELIDWLCARTEECAAELWPATRIVTVGLPGAVALDNRTVTNAPNLPQIETDGFLDSVRRRIGVPVLADNDANLALLGELHFGAAREADTAAMLTLGAGLGAGIAVNGEILRGPTGLVGEFGQLPAGPLGARLEHMVTGPGILRRAAEAGVALDSPAELFASPSRPGVGELRAHFDAALLIVLTALTVACEPERIVLGGGIAKSLGPALGKYRVQLEQTLRVAPALVPSGLGDFSGAMGGVVLSLREVYRAMGVPEPTLRQLP